MNPKVGEKSDNIFYGNATKVTIFSGSEKQRMQFEDDQTNHFAISIMKKSANDNSSSKVDSNKWVQLYAHNDEIYGEVASIARRFNITKDQVRAKKTIDLENFMFGEIEEFNKDLEIIKGLKISIEEYKEKFSYIRENSELEFRLQKSLSNNFDKLAGIKNPYLKSLCRGLSQKSKYTKITTVNKQISDENIKKMQDAVNSVLSKVTARRMNFLKDPQMQLPEGLKKKLGNKNNEVRLKLIEVDNNVFVDNGLSKLDANIKTDGYIYNERPKPNFRFVPYSEDKGKTWVMLNARSLAGKIGLTLKEIKQTAADDPKGDKLLNLINNKLLINKQPLSMDEYEEID